ncbi:MAG: ABC transporter substrate-binding protein [Hyphomicrobiaceae bacterium]
MTTPRSAPSWSCRSLLIAAPFAVVLAASPLMAADLRIGLQEDPDILDPHEARTFVGRIVFNALCDKLVDTDAKLQFVPRIATSWTVADEGKTLAFKLRPGVTFHDGTPLDATAVKANLERAMTAKTSRRKSELKSVAAVETPDATTVVLKLKQKDSTLLAQLSDRAGMLLSPKSFDKPVGPNPVCSGPYSFVERVQNDRIVLKKFAGHWDAANQHFDRIVFRIIPDTTVRLANLRSGQLDMLERLAPTDVKSAKADAALKVVSIAGLGYQGITINLNNTARSEGPLGKDRRVRQALSLSLDRKAINDVVFEGLNTPSIQPFPPASPFHEQAVGVPARDVAKAKALLKAAGHEKVTFEMQVANSTVEQQLAQVIQAMAAEAGFDIKIKATEFASMLKQQSAGNYQATRVGWSGRVDPDGNIHQFVTTGGGINDTKYTNADVDRELNAARTVYDIAKRKAHYAAAMKILRDDLPIMYLYHPSWIWALSSKVDGFVANPDGMIRLSGMKLK